MHIEHHIDFTKPGWQFVIKFGQCVWTAFLFAAALILLCFFGIAFGG